MFRTFVQLSRPSSASAAPVSLAATQPVVTRWLHTSRVSHNEEAEMEAAYKRDTQGILYPQVRRVAALGEKIGMMNMYNEHGVRLDLTVIRIHDCHVVHNSDIPVKKGFGKNAFDLIKVTIGAGTKRPWRIPEDKMEMFERAKVPPKRILKEVLVSPDMVLPIGTRIYARHFVPGQYVDIQGKTTGKGFQGVMKRWGFQGLGASHGIAGVHRSGGSTGACQDPGKVWKGKKMPGRMGGKNKNIEGLQVYKVEPERNLLFVLGHVPGVQGGFVRVRDCFKRPFKNPEFTPDFPAYVPPEDLTTEPKELKMKATGEDPFAGGLEARNEGQK